MVASTTKETYIMFWLTCKLFLLTNSNKLPVNAIKIPSILLPAVLLLKNNAPVIITKIGVKEFKVPARAPSIPNSATQNKYAGKRLPKTPDRKITGILFFGIILKCLIAKGNNTIPEKTMRNEATWNADKCSSPSFIMMKLLPQMTDSKIKINQLKNPLFNI